ncbi:chymotrypsin-related [Holotrichia oblita]|uniref:Chymotrypsin-related n=1 Tax=Holotrichia oblita TaxID=644536 RepID=A0ACB9TIP4_HOLOL|nr:chymotrypsin-related [Holotrichia oblita]
MKSLLVLAVTLILAQVIFLGEGFYIIFDHYLMQASIDLSQIKRRQLDSLLLPKFPFTLRQSADRIVGGSEVERNSIPYQVCIQVFVIYGEVILGAHRFGEIEEGQLRVQVTKFHIHSGWNASFFINDMATIEFDDEIELSDKIQLVNLPSRSDVSNSFANERGRVSGWGIYSDELGTLSPVLRAVEVYVMTNSDCNDLLGVIQSSHVCISGMGGVGSCGGDSGGPFVVDNTLAGVDFPEIKPRNIEPHFRSILPTILESDNTRIVGGNEVEAHSRPYQAALLLQHSDGTFFCGGSLISRKFVLTAAHCVEGVTSAEVILGAHQFRENEEGQIRLHATKFHIHNGWNKWFLINDIAIIELDEEVKLTNTIQLISLPNRLDVGNNFANNDAVVSGWGLDSDQSTVVSPVLREVEVNVMRKFRCNIRYLGVIQDSHICTAGTGGVGSCSGDSGGPLVIGNKQIGIVSFGLALGCEIGWPSVYTRVTSFLDWIEAHSDAVIS